MSACGTLPSIAIRVVAHAYLLLDRLWIFEQSRSPGAGAELVLDRLSTHQQDRRRDTVEHLMGDAAERPALHTAVAVRRHHDQVCLTLRRLVHDDISCRAVLDDDACAQTVRT